ncbi:MAG TPA: endolytic transglycosylase MltG [Clostridiales bacterium]|nr:endolytic transglycosylase MltG [Clostridiales bacterium]
MATKSTSVKATLKITSFIIRLLMNIMFYVLVAFLIVNVSKQAFQFTYELYGPVAVENEPGRDIPIQIKKGESTMDVASKLEVNRAIVNKYSFYIKTKIEDIAIMPGTYEINSSMTYNDILEIITDYSKSLIQDQNIELEEE